MILHCEISRRETFQIERGTHTMNSMLIPLSGVFEYTVEGVTRRLHPYQPLLFKRGTSFHKVVIDPISYIIIQFSQPIEHPGSWLDYEERDTDRLKNSILHLKEAIAEDLPVSIVEHFARDILLTARSENQTKTVKDTAILPAYQYINAHFSEKITLNLLAEKTGYSVQTLIRKFKAQYGKTPIQFITDLRINKAKQLLLHTDDPIGKIAEACGYENVYYFSNNFKKTVGISLLKFRRTSVL